MIKRIKINPEAEIKMLYDQLDVKESLIKNYMAEIEIQRQQLAIAVKALDSLRGICYPQVAEKALEQIKELDK
ncbi:MAG: hypothetical protein J6S67_21685 [Methanobrevibacter sp.]|nr:hypothetical protein [Methanobrevibacter sp.]